jgi:hypothetical protein
MILTDLLFVLSFVHGRLRETAGEREWSVLRYHGIRVEGVKSREKVDSCLTDDVPIIYKDASWDPPARIRGPRNATTTISVQSRSFEQHLRTMWKCFRLQIDRSAFFLKM